MELRTYQKEAVEAVYRHLRERDGNPLVVLPVGSGKSLVLSQIAADAVKRWRGRVLVVTHAAELVEQNADKMRRLCPDLPVGIYSAGLGQRETRTPVLCASIQSIYQRACELDRFDLILVDESHAIGLDGEGMYRQFLAEMRVINPQVRCIGLTATPFRTSQGVIFGPDRFFSDICYEAKIGDLIAQGYLSPLISKAGTCRVDTTGLHVRRGEFVGSEVESLMNTDALVEAAVSEIVEYTRDRHACLIFAAGVGHAHHVARVFKDRFDIECVSLDSRTPMEERAEVLARFRGDPPRTFFGKPPLKYLANYGILTTGFDCPRLDAIAVLRPTMSPGLLVQMLGRGTRLHPGKSDCLVLDYGRNIERHGPIDQIRAPDAKGNAGGEPPAKECPECQSVVHAAYAVCPDCGYEFPPPENQKHEAKASDEGILTGQVIDTEYDVQDVFYAVHTKRGADEDAPKTMRVTYQVGLNDFQSEWVCPEHTGWARQKFAKWWHHRSNDSLPDTAQRAVDIAEAGGVAPTRRITVRKVTGEPFDRIVNYELGEKPESVPLDVAMGLDESSIPF